MRNDFDASLSALQDGQNLTGKDVDCSNLYDDGQYLK
jgi:hypothetical protein